MITVSKMKPHVTWKDILESHGIQPMEKFYIEGGKDKYYVSITGYIYSVSEEGNILHNEKWAVMLQPSCNLIKCHEYTDEEYRYFDALRTLGFSKIRPRMINDRRFFLLHNACPDSKSEIYVTGSISFSLWNRLALEETIDIPVKEVF